MDSLKGKNNNCLQLHTEFAVQNVGRNLEVSWKSLEQNIWLNCRQLSTTTVIFFRPEKDTEMQVLIWGLK